MSSFWRNPLTRASWGFSYKLERKFPFRFFGRSITLVLVILFALFTVFNAATNGYDLQPIFTGDPNATISQRSWFHNSVFTFGDDKLYPRCSARDLSVGTLFLTTNLAFPYTLTNIIDGHNVQRSSIPYLNNTLENCRVNLITLPLTKGDRSESGESAWYSWLPSYATVESQCTIQTTSGLFTLKFTRYHDSDVIAYQYSTPNNWTNAASYWWGSRMLGGYWYGVLQSMANANGTGSPTIANARLSFSVNQKAKSMEGHELFDSSYSFTQESGHLSYDVIDGVNDTTMFNNENLVWSRRLTEGLSFAKMLYSLTLVDVGESTRPNWLLDEKSVQRALESPYNFNRGPDGPLANRSDVDWWRMVAILPTNAPAQNSTYAIPFEQAWQNMSSRTGPLGTRSATILSQYTCNIPTRKSVGTVVWTTIIANFVLLRAAYAIIMFIAESIVAGRDPTAMYCVGCLSQGHLLSNMTPAMDHSDAFLSKGSVSRPDPASRSSSTYALIQRDDLVDR